MAERVTTARRGLRVRRTAELIVFGLSCVLLVGCANVPTSGPIEVGGEIGVGNDPQVGSDFPAPGKGWDKDQIVRGFFDAMSQYEEGYETAQKYLTADAEETWAPTSNLLITDGRPDPTVVNDKTVRLSYEIVGWLGPDASYRPAAAGHIDELTIELSELSGEWRISKPPEGLIMSKADFDREFAVFNTYFFDPSFTYLVADPVYLPTNGPTQTLLVRALLDGPSDWLDSSVVTQFPEGTQGVGSVSLANNTATVELTREAFAGADEERERMAAQLTWTLSQMTDVTDVLAKIGGGFLLNDDPSDVSDFTKYDPKANTRQASLVAVGSSGVALVSPEGELTPVAGPLGQKAGLRELAVHPLRGEAIAIDESGTQLLRSPLHDRGDLETIYTGTELSSVSWDPTGVVWAIDSRAGGDSLVTLTRDGDVVPVTLAGQAGRDIQAISVSPDGTRLALVIDGRAHAGVIKRGSGTVGEIEVLVPRRIGPEGSALDVAWSDGASVALLVEDEDGAVRPYFAGLSGKLEAQDPVQGAVALAVAPLRDLVVETSDGRLFVDGEEFATAHGATYPG